MDDHPTFAGETFTERAVREDIVKWEPRGGSVAYLINSTQLGLIWLPLEAVPWDMFRDALFPFHKAALEEPALPLTEQTFDNACHSNVERLRNVPPFPFSSLSL